MVSSVHRECWRDGELGDGMPKIDCNARDGLLEECFFMAGQDQRTGDSHGGHEPRRLVRHKSENREHNVVNLKDGRACTATSMWRHPRKTSRSRGRTL